MYLSMRCAPSLGECQLFHTLLRRSPLSVREAISEIDESEKLLKSGMPIEDFIKVSSQTTISAFKITLPVILFCGAFWVQMIKSDQYIKVTRRK